MTKKYIELEEAITAIGKPKVTPGGVIFDALKKACQEEVRNLPAADVVEVVQCRECRHAAPNGLDIKCNKHSGSTKSKLGGEISYIELHKPHFFCADGKRMGGGQDDV